MIIILDNLRSAYNVGSILRTCDALGIKNVYLCGITPGIKDPKVLKTALGAEKNINIIDNINTFDTVESLKKSGTKIFGLELNKNAINISQSKVEENIALVVGNEVSGLSDETMKQCDQLVQIPMKGIKESLNVSVAFGIAAYELTKR